MSVWGVAMVRDEADIIEATVTRMRDQVDRVLVADNGSVDGTREILEQLDGVDLVDDPDPAFHQQQKISALTAQAADAGAEWVVPFDADEVWFSRWGRLGDLFAGLPETIVYGPWIDHVATAGDPNGDPVARMGWRRRVPQTLPKVAARTRLPVTILQGAHDAFYACSRALALEVRHFPYRSPEQLQRKVVQGEWAANQAGHPQTVLARWRSLAHDVRMRGADAVFESLSSVDPEQDPDLVYDPCP